MNKIPNGIKQILQWVAASICFLGALIELNMSSLFLIVAGVLFLPIKKIRLFLLEKLKIRGLVACIMAIPFFFIGVLTTPTNTSTSSQGDSSFSAEQSIIEEESKKESLSMESVSREISSEEESFSKEVSLEEESSSSRESCSFAGATSSVNNSYSSGEISSAEKIFTFVLNTSTKKIHYQTCSYASRISSKNKQVVTTTLSELLGMGYTTCGSCF